MKDYEGRKRQFVIPDKQEEELDTPSVRRKLFSRGQEEEEAQPPRQPRVRKTLREREMEEEEASRGVRRNRGPRREEEYEEELEEENEAEARGRKAPRVVRVFAWVALMLILFASGYLATNYFFAWSDSKGGPRIGNVYGSPEEVKTAVKDEAATAAADAQDTYTLYLPDGDTFKSRSVSITADGTQEERMMKVLSMYVDSLKETRVFDPATAITALYQSGDCLYIDMTAAFLTSIKTLGKVKAEQALSGLMQTVKENFSPLRRIKFYVGSREITDKQPVDLTTEWERTK